MGRIVVLCTSDMGNQGYMESYLDKALDALRESRCDFELINMPVYYNSDAILDQIAALGLLDLGIEVQLIIAVGDLAGFVGEHKKLLLYDKEFVEKYGKGTREDLWNQINNMKEKCRYKYCFQDMPLDEWENVLKNIIKETGCANI